MMTFFDRWLGPLFRRRPAPQVLPEGLRDGFAYEVVTTTGKAAMDTWQGLLGAGRGWPVVVGDDRHLQSVVAAFKYNGEQEPGSIADIVTAAESIRVPEDVIAWQAAEGYGEAEDLPVGDWPIIAPPAPRLTLATNIVTGTALPRVHIVLVPTDKSWEVPAYLRWGGSDACPPAPYHVAMLRSWHERFGAELVGLGGDTLNLRVTRPPTQKDDAMAVATEQYYYCPDIVDQGTSDIATLAASLMNQPWWFFWWD